MSHLTPARHLCAALLTLGLLASCSGVIGEASGDGGISPQGEDDGGSGGDAGSGDAGSGDAGSTPVFVAQGHAGRTTVSCDDGNTWVANRSDNDSIVCFTNGVDCDHQSGAGRGITFGQGYFVATFGWGAPGTVRRSRNGVQWETMLSSTESFAGVVFGADTFMLGGRPPRLSTDRGASWQAGGEVHSEQWNVRRSGFAAHGGGRLVLAFGSEGNDVNISSDRGVTWTRPATLPAACAGDMQWSGGIEYGNGVMLIVGGTGVACRSTDGGQTWTETSVGGAVSAQLLWTGTEFLTWGRTGNGTPALFRSTNGAAWTATPTVVRRRTSGGATSERPGPDVGAVARSDTGTFVAVRGGWQVWYDQQEFYRSTDGITWDALPPGAFAGSHPIQFIAFGRTAPGVSCP
jgi:hypothetical protein